MFREDVMTDAALKPVETTMADTARTPYVIAGRRFYQTELVWGQVRWLHARLKGYPLAALAPEQVLELLSEELAGVLAIVLVDEGKTQADKVAAGPVPVAELEQWLAGHLRPDDAIPILQDFFASAQLPKLLNELGRLMPVTAKTTRAGLTAPSSTSAAAIPVSSPGSSGT